MYVYIHMYTYKFLDIYIYIYIYTHIYIIVIVIIIVILIYVYLYISLYILYIHIYAYIHTYVYTYIYIYRERERDIMFIAGGRAGGGALTTSPRAAPIPVSRVPMSCAINYSLYNSLDSYRSYINLYITLELIVITYSLYSSINRSPGCRCPAQPPRYH